MKKIIYCLFLCACLKVSCQSAMPHALATGTFSLFTDESDWYMNTIDWTKISSPNARVYGGINQGNYHLGAGGKLGSVYLAGAYTGKFPAYGFSGNIMTDFTLNLFAGFADRWAIKVTYFDQNFPATATSPSGRGKVFTDIQTGTSVPFSTGLFNIVFGIKNTFLFSSIMQFDIYEPDFSLQAEYEFTPLTSMRLRYSAELYLPGFHNTTIWKNIPVRHSVEAGYSHTWRFTERFSLAFSLDAHSNIHANHAAGNWDIGLELPAAFTYAVVSDVFTVYAGLKVGYRYASYDHTEGERGGNKKGHVPVMGFSAGSSLYMMKNASFQIATQFEYMPYYSKNGAYGYEMKKFSLLSIAQAPLDVSLRVLF